MKRILQIMLVFFAHCVHGQQKVDTIQKSNGLMEIISWYDDSTRMIKVIHKDTASVTRSQQCLINSEWEYVGTSYRTFHGRLVYIMNIIPDSSTSDVVVSGFYPNGLLQYTDYNRNGKNNGMYFEYYPTGKLKIQGEFQDMVPFGRWKWFDSTGILEKTGRYTVVELDSASMIKYLEFADDWYIDRVHLKHGEWFYYKQGELIRRERYNFGQRIE